MCSLLRDACHGDQRCHETVTKIKPSIMNNRLSHGFLAGCIGAIILVVIMYLLQAMDMGAPGFVGMYRQVFGENPPADQFIAALLFIISGGIWGLLFGLLVKAPTLLKGMLFGLLPTLWLWTAVNGALGKPLFNGFETKGLLMPLLFNVVIWGGFVGWYMANRFYHAARHRVEKV
jgi:hypothetical protein